MDFPIPDMAAQDRYKIMTATIVPRPIAWVTSRSGDGILNAAPYSFFNMMGHDPATVALGVLPGTDGLKDTAANICETGEFCVNLVSEDMAEAMKCSKGTIMSRLFHARKNIQKHLTEMMSGTEDQVA